jgi:hypothetical protein
VFCWASDIASFMLLDEPNRRGGLQRITVKG